MAQSVERRIGSAEVTGPIPVGSLGKVLHMQGFFCDMYFIILQRENRFMNIPMLLGNRSGFPFVILFIILQRRKRFFTLWNQN